MKEAQEIIDNSGYPLQIRLEEWIKDTSQQSKWRVLVKEHRWINAETKEEGYIDLVLEHDEYNLTLVIECKRINGIWTFLLPKAQPPFERKTRILSLDYETLNLLWKESRINPDSFEASYCVMETGGKKDSRTLEKLAGELLLSLEYLAIEEFELVKSKPAPKRGPGIMLYLPIIVTTATLQTMTFNPANIDVKNGKITNSTTTPVEVIRFRKNLATHVTTEKQEVIFP